MNNELSSLCKLISQGVYLIGVQDGERQNAFTAAWVMQVSFDPLLIVFSISPKHYSYQLLRNNPVCTINVLQQQQLDIAEHFGCSGLSDKMAGFNWLQAEQTGAPVFAQALAYFDCKVSSTTQAGDHELVICNVVHGARLHAGQPMLYSDTGEMDGSAALYKS